MNIYVASSWRNELQPTVCNLLKSTGHAVYDFRHPSADEKGFSWSEIDPNWQNWSPAQYRDALLHPIAARGYQSDINALNHCDACVLVLPSGRSASWEFGYAMGQGKLAAVVMLEPCEPELMYRGAYIATTLEELTNWAHGFLTGLERLTMTRNGPNGPFQLQIQGRPPR